ncbi:hypothetical protein WDW89_04440 [Deltaproteobacteria bacterium TL4]
MDDALIDGNQNYTIVLTTDTENSTQSGAYLPLNPDDVAAVNIDNETAGLVIGSLVNTAETGTSTKFTVKLSRVPTGNVVLNVASSDLTEGTVSPASLTFITSANWNANQEVTVTGVNDNFADGNQSYIVSLTVNTTSTADTSGYAALSAVNVALLNIDNETAGFTLSAISSNTAEDGTTATFTVKLNSEPTGDVVLDLLSSDLTEATVSPASFTFTSANWNTNQTGTVTGVNDAIDEGNQAYRVQLSVNQTATTDATGYLGLTEVVHVTNTDDETVGLTVSTLTSSSSNSGNTAEDGTQATFTVKLNSEPTGDVVLALVSSDTKEGTISPASLTFTPLNWNANQMVTVTGVDDTLADGNQNYTLQVSVATGNTQDTSYAALPPAIVEASNRDVGESPASGSV